MMSLQDDMLAVRMTNIEPTCVEERGTVNDTMKNQNSCWVLRKLYLPLNIIAHFM